MALVETSHEITWKLRFVIALFEEAHGPVQGNDDQGGNSP
jgi:hypothetical protein